MKNRAGQPDIGRFRRLCRARFWIRKIDQTSMDQAVAVGAEDFGLEEFVDEVGPFPVDGLDGILFLCRIKMMVVKRTGMEVETTDSTAGGRLVGV